MVPLLLPLQGRYRKVEFGVDSEGSELYPILTTMPGDLNEFGLGVAMFVLILASKNTRKTFDHEAFVALSVIFLYKVL